MIKTHHPIGTITNVQTTLSTTTTCMPRVVNQSSRFLSTGSTGYQFLIKNQILKKRKF